MNHNRFMKEALAQAQIAYENDEVPVGAVIVYKGEIIAKAYNTNYQEANPLVHAEMKVIDQASKILKTRYLDECDLYVSLEPCLMCTGAIINSRIRKVYFASFDLNNGALISTNNANKIEWYGGILAEEAKKLLSSYFENKR